MHHPTKTIRDRTKYCIVKFRASNLFQTTNEISTINEKDKNGLKFSALCNDSDIIINFQNIIFLQW